MNCGSPIAVSRLAEVRDCPWAPASVITGKPAHSASQVVVVPL